MWKTGTVAGYTWEAIVNNGRVTKIAVRKCNENVTPSYLLKLFVKIAVIL